MDNPVLQVVEAAKDNSTGGGSNFTLSVDEVGVDLGGGAATTTVKKVAAK
jgi:hypothetical protein